MKISTNHRHHFGANCGTTFFCRFAKNAGEVLGEKPGITERLRFQQHNGKANGLSSPEKDGGKKILASRSVSMA